MNSNKVFVFPCVGRQIKDAGGNALSNEDLKGKLMSEENVTNIIKSITDENSYVINDDLDNLEFIIDGYYFKLSEYSLTGNKYAYITTTNSSVGKLIVGDNSSTNVFGGLTITDTIPDVENYLTLCEDGKIPQISRIKFSCESLNMSNIDCGELK